MKLLVVLTEQVVHSIDLNCCVKRGSIEGNRSHFVYRWWLVLSDDEFIYKELRYSGEVFLCLCKGV